MAPQQEYRWQTLSPQVAEVVFENSYGNSRKIGIQTVEPFNFGTVANGGKKFRNLEGPNEDFTCKTQLHYLSQDMDGYFPFGEAFFSENGFEYGYLGMGFDGSQEVHTALDYRKLLEKVTGLASREMQRILMAAPEDQRTGIQDLLIMPEVPAGLLTRMAAALHLRA